MKRRSRMRARHPRRRVRSIRRGDTARAKTIAIAAEPPRDNDLAHLNVSFRNRLQRALAALTLKQTPFRFAEGFRSVERQQWLYGSGRPGEKYGRPGPIVTKLDGVRKRSNHQGNGTPGSGMAADCYPLRNGKAYIPRNNDPVWDRYAEAVETEGLIAGHHWASFPDSSHCELKDDNLMAMKRTSRGRSRSPKRPRKSRHK
jgi:hypothetical protein